MKRLFWAFVLAIGVLSWGTAFQQRALGQVPEIKFIKPDALQEGNTIKWEFKVKPNGVTVNKVTLDILPLGGVPVFGQPEPLPSGRGFYKPFTEFTVDDGWITEEGKTKKLPKGKYLLVVIATYSGTKTVYKHHFAVVDGGATPPFGKITDDMDYVPPVMFVAGKRIKMHGKYEALDMDHTVKNFVLTLLAPNGTAQIVDKATTPTYTHTFDAPVAGMFEGYVRSPVWSAGNIVAHVYTTRHEKKVP